MERLIDELKSVPLAKRFDDIFYPGEIEARNEERCLREGLLLPQQTLADLTKLGRETGREALLPF